MFRENHFYYDVREALGGAKFLIGFLIFCAFFTLFISTQLIYLFVILFVLTIGIRALIGRRCPKCDGPLIESGAEPAKDNAFVIYINWVCPRDGYVEREETKGDAGLFGAN